MATAGGVPRTDLRTSSCCDVEDLCLCLPPDDDPRLSLWLGSGWSTRWTTTWRLAGADVSYPVGVLGSLPMIDCRPVRRFSWRPSQRHRPGLQYMVSTGRHHGFESIAEQRLLLALDFVGDVVGVFSQPFRLRFATTTGWEEHVPDFLVVSHDSVAVFDVRPAERVEIKDRVRFAATAEVALTSGWRYMVVTGWRPHVMATLDTLSAHRRALADPLDLQTTLLNIAADGPRAFSDLVTATTLPPMARAHALHLIWHHSLAIDLAVPLTDAALIWSADEGGR